MYKNDYLLYRIVDSFWRHWRVFVLSFVCVTGVVGGALYNRSKSFSASAATQVISDTRVAEAVGQGPRTPTTWLSLADQNAQRFRDLLRDNLPGGFVEEALKQAKLSQPIRVDPAADDPRLDLLMRNLKVASESSDVFTLSLNWNDPAECTRILAAFQQQYIDSAGANNQATSIAVTKYLDSEIEKYAKKMRETEATLIAYKQAHSGVLPDAQVKQIEQLSVLQTQLNQLRITSKNSLLKQQQLEKELSKIKPVSVKEAIMATNPLSLDIRALQEKRRALTTAKYSPYLPTSTTIRQLDADIARLKKQLAADVQADPTSSKNISQTTVQDNPYYRELSQELSQAKIAQNIDTAQMALLEKQIAEYKRSIALMPAAEKELTDKTRDYMTNKKQYEKLLEGREQASQKASLEKITESSTYRPIGRIYAESTAGPKKTLLTIIGSSLLGLIVGLGLVMLSEWLDPSLRYATDASRLLGVPVLVSLPEAGSQRMLPAPSASPSLPGAA